MIYKVKRFSVVKEKHFSIWSDTLDWAKKFTPRIPLGDKSNLILLGPWTMVGGVIGFFKGLASKFSHWISGKPSNDHEKEKIHSTNLEKKQFSDVSLDADYKEYCKIIPKYEELSVLSSLNYKLLDQLTKENRKFIWQVFPSFLVISSPEKINEFRKDFIDKFGEDYAEIMFSFGGEIDYIWDFDRESWYTRDHTYNPAKEWKISGNDIIGCIKQTFNPEMNDLLKERLKKWESDEKLSSQFDMRKYCEEILKLIETVNKK